VTGLARQAADDLRAQGFKITATSTSKTFAESVTVGYSSPYPQVARTVSAAFPGAILVKDDSAGKVIQVTLGSGSPYVIAVPNRIGSSPLPEHTATVASAPSPSVTIRARTADNNICVR